MLKKLGIAKKKCLNEHWVLIFHKVKIIGNEWENNLSCLITTC